MRYLELIWYKTYADLKAERERTYLGFLWWMFAPLMNMGVFYIFFVLLLGHRSDDFVPFLLIGLTVWQWLKSCLTHGSETILGAQPLMQQVHLPKVIFPIILILTDSVKFLFIFGLLLIFLWSYGFGVGWAYLALPFVLGVQLLLITALTFWLAAIVPFVPDVRFVLEEVLLAVFFVSGVIVKGDIVPVGYRDFYYWNPVVTLVESYRGVLMDGVWPPMMRLMWIGLGSLIGVGLGVGLISRFEYLYPKLMR